MKKILFSLVALVAAMSMNAQVMKVMKGNTVVAEYPTEQADNVVFEETPLGTAYAQRTGGIFVKCVQLWENGPKFADYNVGAASVTEYGGYYRWFNSIDKDNTNIYLNPSVLPEEDTATKLWGDAWRMPTEGEFRAMFTECNTTWTDDYNGSGVAGRIFTGKGAYSGNSVFFPAAGRYDWEYWVSENVFGAVVDAGHDCYYWTSTPIWDNAYNLACSRGYQDIENFYSRSNGFSVRAVLAE